MTLSKKIFLIVGSLFLFVGLSAGIVFSAKHEPAGIPQRMLPMYKQKIAEVKQRLEFAKSINQEIYPLAFVADKTYEFGLLDPHTTESRKFYVENRGEAPLTLEVLDTTCKCTVGKVGDHEILPGGAGVVTLTWNTGYQAETYTQTATVKTNDPLHETIELTVTGTVRSDITMPSKLSLGSLNPGEAGSVEFIVYSQRWEDFDVADVTSQLEGFWWDVQPISVDHRKLRDTEARGAWAVKLSATGKGTGRFSDDVEFVFKGPDGVEEIRRTVAVSGKVRSKINFYGMRLTQTRGLDIETVHNDRDHEFPLIVRLRGVEPQPIEVLDLKPEGLQARLEPIDDRQYRLVVVVPAGCPQQKFNRPDRHGYVEVGSPNEGGDRNWIDIYGAVHEAP